MTYGLYIPDDVSMLQREDYTHSVCKRTNIRREGVVLQSRRLRQEEEFIFATGQGRVLPKNILKEFVIIYSKS